MIGNGPYVLGNGLHGLSNGPYVLGNGPHLLVIMSHSALCRIWVMSFGIMSFGFMSHSGLCRSAYYRCIGNCQNFC